MVQKFKSKNGYSSQSPTQIYSTHLVLSYQITTSFFCVLPKIFLMHKKENLNTCPSIFFTQCNNYTHYSAFSFFIDGYELLFSRCL